MTFSENDIRPAHFNFDKEAAYARDVERLLRWQDSFIDVPCPACGTVNTTTRWRKHTLHYRECAECATVYISPRPNEAALRDYYTNSELYAYWREHIFPASEAVRREKIVKPRLERLRDICERHQVPVAKLVEVGPGFGTFCEEAQASGLFKEVVAIEPTPPMAAACRARGLRVIEQPIEQVALDQLGADVVVAFEVIEHLLEPRAFLQACFSAVRPGGLVTVTCPNVEGFEILELGTIADTIDTEHLNYFNPRSLALLAQSAGFEVLEVTTPGVLDADIVRNKVLDQKHTLDHSGFLRRVLIEDWPRLGQPFQKFLQDQRLSTHMWLAARRPRA
jgi:2-polyprenyl-3-methyl-5-hydroxy-6-metoxy-1,4-benzoquinol methylase/Zn ribbon nucleic-acid-binding protein